jgi:hypothetical protein
MKSVWIYVWDFYIQIHTIYVSFTTVFPLGELPKKRPRARRGYRFESSIYVVLRSNLPGRSGGSTSTSSSRCVTVRSDDAHNLL